MISWLHLVQPQYFSSGIVEFVMVYLDVCERCVELNIYIALPRRKLESCHSGMRRW